MLKPLDNNLWVAQQPLRYMGLSLGTRMTVIRQQNQQLAVISPIQPSDSLLAALKALGPVEHIIAPNCYHYLFAADFKAAFPQATFWAAPGLAQKQPDLLIDQNIEPTQAALGSDLALLFFEGYRTLGPNGFDNLNECVFFHAQSRTLILTDTAFYFDNSFPWAIQLAARVLGSYQSLRPSILEKIATKETALVRSALNQILKWDFDRVIVAHGNIVETQGKSALKAGYEAFLGEA